VVCVYVCLLISRERDGRLPLNFQGSSEVVGTGPKNLHFFGSWED